MDELIDQILSSSSWVDMSAVNRSSLNTGDRRPANCMPGDSVGALQGSSRVATMSIVPSSCLSGNSGGQGQNKDAQNGSSNVIADQNTPFLSKKPLIGSQVRKDPIIASPVPGQSQHDSMSTMDVNSRAQANQESAHISLQKQVENNTASGSIGLQLNSDGSASPHGVSSQVSPAVGGATTVAVALPGSASGRTSGNEALGIHRHRGGTHSPVPTESLWCQSYMAGVSPIPSVLAQGKSEAFVLHGETTQGEGHFLGKRCRLEEESQERENRSATTGLDGFRGNPLPSYIGTQAGPTPSNITGGTQPPEQNPGVQMLQSSHGNSLQQHVNQSVISQPQSAATAGAATNGAARPRVRARRGQATDPHSIAERVRKCSHLKHCYRILLMSA
eukprot:Gb_21366 [translate_table: standard]